MTILESLKEVFGEDRVLSIATFSREGSRSALLSACRGLGIDNSESQYLANLIPSERGKDWSLSDCYFGNGEDRKPVSELIREVEKYEGLKEASLKIEGLVKNSSVHASGVYVFNDRFTKQNAMMKSSKGIETTQFDMEDSDYMGGLKIDLLTVQNMDKIRVTMDLLIEHGYIEWQGDLKSTYDKYLHPDVLDYKTPEMWKMVGDNAILDLFQFDTAVGLQTAQKIRPTNVIELASANNLMRLKGDGIQPVDKYILHRDNPEIWEKEMDEYELNEKEKQVIRKHLGEAYGVSDSQEEIMLLSMDKKIANFSVQEANMLRKAVARINAKVLAEVKELFFKKGQENGNRVNILRYVWDKQILPQSGYGFSQLHSSAYSLIALQNMNLAYHYPQVFWNTACLTVNSQASSIDLDKDKSTDYGKIGTAIGDMKQRGIKLLLPDINKSDYVFKPVPESNSIMFGLRGISGVGTEVALSIIENRPYTSLEDFIERMVDTKIVKNVGMIQLIKAGAFDSFGNRKEIMERYLKTRIKPRKSITMSSFGTIINLGIVPEHLSLHARFYNYRKYIQTLTCGKSDERSTKNRLFKLDEVSTEFLQQHFSSDCIIDYDDYTGLPIVAEWLFDREYEEKIKPVRQWLSKKEVVDLVNQAEFKEIWDKYASGTLSEWEMSSVTFYYSGHELDNVDLDKYGIVDFNKLPSEPEVTGTYKVRGREINEFKLSRIAGTVLDKDNIKNTVTLLTTTGVVTVKLYDSMFSKYDRQIKAEGEDGKQVVVDSSWFTRGNKLVFTGFRRGNQFVPRVYRHSVYRDAVMLITQIKNNELTTVSERYSQF